MEETAYHCTDPPRLGISNGMELFPLAPYSPQTMNRALDALIYSYAVWFDFLFTKACLFVPGSGSKK